MPHRSLAFAALCLATACRSTPPDPHPDAAPDAADVPAAPVVDVGVAPLSDAGLSSDMPALSSDTPSSPDTFIPPSEDAPAPDDTPSLPDAPSLPDVPAAPPDAGGAAMMAPREVLPPWDAATLAHVRALRARGVAMGNRAGVFAKIGDSITESASFLMDVGYGWAELGPWASLMPTVAFFRATTLGDPEINAFNRPSVCAVSGWTTADALAGGDASPLARELAATRPAWAIVMYGTNDVDRMDVPTYRTNLLRILDVIEAAGTVPALSTIPDRSDGVEPGRRALAVNAAIRDIAATRHLPLLDYWVALQTLPSHGISPDGIHPNVYVRAGNTASADFSAEALRYGYNVRNLTALQLLDRLRAIP